VSATASDKCNYNHFPVWKGKNQGIKIYCHFVLNPNITIKRGVLTHNTQANGLMWPRSSLLILMRKKFFPLMTQIPVIFEPLSRTNRENRSIRIYCHFVLNPNITNKNGTLTHNTQQNWLMWVWSSLLIYMPKQRFFAFMTSDTSSIWTTIRNERANPRRQNLLPCCPESEYYHQKWTFDPRHSTKLIDVPQSSLFI